ncbi:TPA: MFS transporter [Bacillus anthracis]|uniref:MFS transporter n=1 Tax=Bacillus anthracis TaxID=1392 RepID=UPI0024153519|nr:MFS transporter [Bacillus anthracis]WFN63717.1 MFS transporter [Bacillus anthracis]HDR3502781.1 MFS transporter [Bacillus anthracis]HDR3537158.1 MFS transporter [Bacillus anthracis]HDR3546175.1 MFS transporter [Bacillus anthracis]HDR3666415.1 MFS transporter [Bacillus anthracis]
MQSEKLWTKDFLGTCFSSLFLFLTFYMLMTTLPVYVIDGLKGKPEEIGLVATIFLISSVLCRPFTGKWLDDLGRKKILFISLSLFLAATVMYFGAQSLFLLLALRFLHGIGFGMATTATGTIVTDVAPAHRRGEALAYFGVFMSLPMVIGPFLGLTIISHFSFTVLFIVCSVFSLLAFLLGLLVNIPHEAPVSKQKQEKMKWKDLLEPSSIPIALTGFVLAFSYSGILSFIPIYAKELGLADIASYFFILYALVVVISRPFTGKIFDRFGENVLVYPAIIIFTIGMFILSQAQTPFWFLGAGMLIGLGYGTLIPSFQTIAISAAPNHRRGSATATYFSFFDSGIGFGSFILGIVAAKSSYHNMYFIAAIIVAFTLLLYYGLHGRKQKFKKQRTDGQISA